MRHPPKHRRRRPPHKSPFLDLPPEICNYIYRTALVNPAPIDLCPAKYDYRLWGFEADSVLHKRHSLFMQDDLKIIHRHHNRMQQRHNEPVKLAFRLQSGLQHVRKCLSPHLLQARCQIYREAAPYYWGGNVWRFTDDQDWRVLLRFLLSIGSNARSMINRLDVLAPFTWVEDHEFTWADGWHIKNRPKLHMTKLWEPDGDEECYDIVYNLWIRERSLQLLNMLVPARYTFSSLDAEGHSWDDPYFYEPPPKALPKVQVIVESQATVLDIKHILVQGWDVVALPGSRLVRTIDSDTYEAHHIAGKAKKWESDGDYLYGISHLFEEEDISIHANGGKAKSSWKWERVNRVLKAFGPCMIGVFDVP